MPQITGVGLVISCLYDHSLGAADVWLRRGSRPPFVTRRPLRRAHDQPAVSSHPSEAPRATFAGAARCADSLAGQPHRLIRGEEHDDRRDVLWLSKPATERRCRYPLLGVRAANKPDAVGTLGRGVTRRHG